MINTSNLFPVFIAAFTKHDIIKLLKHQPNWQVKTHQSDWSSPSFYLNSRLAEAAWGITAHIVHVQAQLVAQTVRHEMEHEAWSSDFLWVEKCWKRICIHLLDTCWIFVGTSDFQLHRPILCGSVMFKSSRSLSPTGMSSTGFQLLLELLVLPAVWSGCNDPKRNYSSYCIWWLYDVLYFYTYWL